MLGLLYPFGVFLNVHLDSPRSVSECPKFVQYPGVVGKT